jgi:hypothetical protein
MEFRFQAEAGMNVKRHIKWVREGDLVAEVEVDFIEDSTGWSPYLSTEDAGKLDEVRAALRRKDTAGAEKLARIYRLTPVRAA